MHIHIPRRLSTVTGWLRFYVGRRGAYLLFLTLLDLVMAYGLMQKLPFGLSRAAVYGPFLEIMPLPAWAALWAATGLLTLVAALWRTVRPAAFCVAAFIKIAWSAGYLVGWVEGLPAYTRAYQTATIYIAFALVTLLVAGWRENGR